MDHPSTLNKKTILVVDDNQDILDTTVQLLRIMGYNAISASNGAEGLKIIESGVKVDVILSDVVMPGPVRSVDLGEYAREFDSKIKVIYVTGYGDTSKMLVGELATIIEKPFDIEKLEKVINRVLTSEKQ